MTTLDRFGIAVQLPTGWEGEIYRRPATATELRLQEAGALREQPPVAHAASFALPPDRGDFGNGAVDLMGPRDIFVSLFEYEPPAAATPLFSSSGIPHLDDADFDTGTLQRTLPGQSGCQRFFHLGDRAFCLYVVLGNHRFRSGLVRRVNALLESLRID